VIFGFFHHTSHYDDSPIGSVLPYCLNFYYFVHEVEILTLLQLEFDLIDLDSNGVKSSSKSPR
jgi:hypothetical protein